MLHHRYKIDTVIQTGLVKEGLPTLYLEELLGLSCDEPINYFTFDESEAERRLEISPLIEKALVRKVKPNAIYIDYEVRRPVALLVDFANVAIDTRGYTFPLMPYLSPSKFPEIYLGIKELPEQIKTENFQLALDVLQSIEWLNIPMQHCKRVDVSSAYHLSCGKKEIVVVLDALGREHFLRLETANYQSGLEKYLVMKMQTGDTNELSGDKVIDLRIPKLGFISDLHP